MRACRKNPLSVFATPLDGHVCLYEIITLRFLKNGRNRIFLFTGLNCLNPHAMLFSRHARTGCRPRNFEQIQGVRIERKQPI